MKLSIFILLIGLFAVQIVYAQATDLFISEYLEGSSNNKAIEIYNGTGNDVDLSNYMIKKATNGDGWTDSNYTFPENAVISSYDVWVIANNAANATILNAADQTLPSASDNYFMGFNGDDAIGLFKNGVLLDIIGNPTEDPGSGWAVAGINEATFNHTLIRKSYVDSGNTDWNSSAGTTTDNSEWEVNDEDYMSNLGQHTFDGAPDVIPPAISSVTATSSTTAKIVFTEKVTSETANEISNYSITGLDINSLTFQADSTTVILETSEQTSQQTYLITISNIQDLAGNIMETSYSTFTGFLVIHYIPIRNIQDSLDVYNGQMVTVKGVVTIGDALLHPGKTQFYIQDESGRGIQVYNSSQLGQTYIRGDYIGVTGTIGLYTGTSGTYNDVQISNPTVTLLSEGENLPSPYILTGDEDLVMNGTWGKINGVISDIWDASDQYGFYKITATLDNGVDRELMFWNSAVSPDSISQYLIGDKISGYGVIAFYNGASQLTCGYAEDIGEYVPGGEYDYVSFDPEEPKPGQETTIIFNDGNEEFTEVYIYWKRNYEISYNYYLTEPSADSTTFTYTLPAQKAGTRVQFYYKAYKDSTEILYPADAPAKLISIDFSSSGLIANLSIPAKPFDPSIGETFPIVFSANSGDKAILKIYNIEGKLKLTLYNGVISSYSGIMDIAWNGKDKNNNLLPIGLYICYLEVHDRYSGKTKTDKAPIMIGTQLK